jgi:transcriptional regulator GlxA family with amidase domain
VTRVLFVLFNGVQSLDVTGPLEVFAGANTWCQRRGEPNRYVIRTASLGGGPVRTSSGLRISPDGDLAGQDLADGDLAGQDLADGIWPARICPARICPSPVGRMTC